MSWDDGLRLASASRALTRGRGAARVGSTVARSPLWPGPGGILDLVAERWHTVPPMAALCHVDVCKSQYLQRCGTTHNPRLRGAIADG